MQQVLFDVDFGYVLRTTAADLILLRTQDEITLFFFITIIFHKNPRLIVAQNLKNASLHQQQKDWKQRRINFKSWKQLNSVLIHNDEILVIFQYLQAKYCNDSKITECCFKQRKQLINIWMFSSQKKKNSVLFRFCSFTMLQKKSLLKLTEHSELDSKITLKTWSSKLTWTFSEFKE